jgi:hemoglobin-like flavoprotein
LDEAACQDTAGGIASVSIPVKKNNHSTLCPLVHNFIKAKIVSRIAISITCYEAKENHMALQVYILEQSFNRILIQKQAFAQTFYDRLFEQFPQVKPLFRNTDLKLQQNKLLGALALVVSNLRHPEKLAEPLKELGKRHESYHVHPEHYAMVGTILVETLARFDPAWTLEVQIAWIGAYQAVVELTSVEPHSQAA